MKTEIKRRKTGKICKVVEIKPHTKEIRKYLEPNNNKNTVFQNLWDAVKVVLRGKCMAINAYVKKQESSQINNLTLQPKELEKE